MGTYDDQGIYRFDESDTITPGSAPFSGLLNKLSKSVRDRMARVDITRAENAVEQAELAAEQAEAFGGTNNEQVAGMVAQVGPTRTEVERAFVRATASTPGAAQRQMHPDFQKAGVQFNLAASGLPSFLEPMVFCTDGIIQNPLGRFYALIGTDHDSAASAPPFQGKGGIVLMYANSPTGPWTRHNKPDGTLAVYQDTVVGDQTETPYVVYWPSDPDGKPIYCYYGQQGAGINQSTVLAKSATGRPEDFTRVGIVIQGRNGWPGDGQTTYFRPTVLEDMIIGRHLQGGGDNAQLTLSYSYDGVNFITDPRRLGHFSDQVGADNGRRLVFGSAFQWRGDWFAIATLGPHTSGFLNQARSLNTVRLTRDFRSIIGAPKPFSDTTITSGAVMEFEGNLYLYYRTGDAYSSISLAIAEA